MNWDDYSYIVRSKERRRVFIKLVKPKTPSELARELNKKIPQISRTLGDLSRRGLVECINPDEHVGKLFILTKKGKEVLEQFKE